jgi:hypothetical protein
MADLAIVNELSSAQLTISFLDERGNAMTPVTVDYRIDCMTTERAILPWTSAGAPSSTMTITITSAQNAIINEANGFETKMVTVRANYGETTEFTSQYAYQVENLPGLP